MRPEARPESASSNPPATEDARIVVDLDALHQLIPAPARRSYQVISPTLCDGQYPAGASAVLEQEWLTQLHNHTKSAAG